MGEFQFIFELLVNIFAKCSENFLTEALHFKQAHEEPDPPGFLSLGALLFYVDCPLN